MNPFGTSTSASAVISSVATSTTEYLGNFAPIFEFMIGLILAMALIAWLVSMFSHRGRGRDIDLDDTLMDI